MKRIFTLAGVVFLWVWGSILQAQNISFSYLTIEDGLSQSTCFDVQQDTTGLVWIATHDGLNRFDGYKFRVFRQQAGDSASLCNSIVRCLQLDGRGTLWVGTAGGGLARWLAESETFRNFAPNDPARPGLGHGMIRNMSLHQGHIWLATDQGLSLLDWRTEQFVELPPAFGRLARLACHDVQETPSWVFVSTDAGLFRYDKASQRIERMRPPAFAPATPDSLASVDLELGPDGFLWVAFNSGLGRFSIEQGRFVEHFAPGDGSGLPLPHQTVLKVFFDSRGNLWVGTSDGLVVREASTGRAKAFSMDDGPGSILHNNIASLYEDEAGVVWVGAWEMGISKHDPYARKFRLVESDGRPDLPARTVRMVFPDRDSVLWIGYVEGGLARLDRSTGRFDHYHERLPGASALPDYTASALCLARDGTLWVGTWGHGLQRGVWHDSARRDSVAAWVEYSRESRGLAHNAVQAILEDSRGLLWVATGEGLDVLDPASDSLYHLLNLPGQTASSIQGALVEDRWGQVWAGSWGGLHRVRVEGPGRFAVETFTHAQHGLPDDRVISMDYDGQGRLFVGTFGGGLAVLTDLRQQPRSQAFAERDGLANNVVYGLHLDPASEQLWASTNKGLSRLDLRQGGLANYDVSHGLQSDGFFWGASARGASGELFFGGIKGLNAFFPWEVKDNPYMPRVAATDLKLYNVSLAPSPDGILKRSVVLSQSIELSYQDKVIAIEFAALHFSVPGNHLYAYRLLNFDDEWIYTDAKNRLATYTNLDPGRYVFQVKATNSDGVWSDHVLSLELVVLPPFYATWWFRLALGAALAFMAFTFYKVRVRRIKEHNRELQRLVGVRTAELVHKNQELEAKHLELEQKNAELEQQKEEIMSQNEQISSQRDQLEKRNAEVSKQRDFIGYQHEEIKSSIRYAQTIQEAMLPYPSELHDRFECFLLFRPRDIVSGDFYWFAELDVPGQGTLWYLAVADCTGHGVPGAFMSMIGLRLIRQVLVEEREPDLGRALLRVNQMLVWALKQKQSENDDGMDVCLCCLRPESGRVEFAGAKRPLYHYQAATASTRVLRGDRFSIGGKRDKPGMFFQTQRFEMEPGDAVYLSSDGFVDQNDRHRK